ncbi:MAG: putative transporter [Betaproteobacteria bacterium]|nr:putative transporter [Betaproteobacteria bacterium]
MLKSFFGDKKWALWAWGGGALLCALVVVEVRVIVWLNGWYRKTWDFLQNPHPLLKDSVKDAETDWRAKVAEMEGGAKETAETLADLAGAQLDFFWGLILEFCWIVFPFIVLRAFNNFFARHYAFRWRQAITFAYLPLWEKTTHEIEGASQRLQQDPERFARIVESLGLGVVRSVLTLAAFVPILWGVSAEIMERFAAAEGLNGAPFSLPFLEWTAMTPASLVWVAVLLSLGGTGFSFLVGIKLPGLEYNNQRVEARFRKRLTYGEDDKTFADFPSLLELFTGLRFNYFRLFLHYSYFALWSGLFLQFIVIADLILIGAGVVLGIITFGFLNQISHAFSKVAESLAYFVDNWTTVTELMSVVKRLREFEQNIGYAKGVPAAETAQKL